jgi:hypothetical protein
MDFDVGLIALEKRKNFAPAWNPTTLSVSSL